MESNGLVIACDVPTYQDLEGLVSQTSDLGFVYGFKVGSMLALLGGLREVCQIVRTRTLKPIIYDHQKFGTDIPEMCGGKILDTVKQAGVTEIIAFPFAGINTLKAFVEGCRRCELRPIVGAEMTHTGFLVKDGGYIANSAPQRIYSDATELGVEHFVIPATKPERMRKYRRAIERVCKHAVFLFPGVGKGQGGDIAEAFKQVHPHAGLAIVGRGVYAHPEPRKAAEELWAKVTPSQR